MGSGTIAFLLGVVALQQLPELPSATFWVAAFLFFGLLGLAGRALGANAFSTGIVRITIFVMLGFSWAAFRSAWLLSDALPPVLEGKDLVIEGIVAGLPESDEATIRFDFIPEQVVVEPGDPPFKGRMRLTWYERGRELRAGERWHLTVRLKRPRGMMNPGGFDYESWLFQHRVQALGYVREDTANRRLAVFGGSPVDRVRDRLRRGILEAVGDQPTAGILVALAIGDGSLISSKEWDLFRDTGTTHLMAISGLHVGMVALLMGFFVRRLWRHPRLLHLVPAQKAATLAGFAAAAAYALLAGFSVPTQRTLVMLGAVAFALLTSRSYRPATMLGFACWAVLLFDPLAVLASGFWLSFGAVTLILYGMHGRLRTGGLWWKWGRVQWLVTVGLTPVLVAFFGSASIASPVANLIAVPWVSFVVVPLTLLGTMSMIPWPALGALSLKGAALAMSGLWPILQSLAYYFPAVFLPMPPLVWVGTGLVGVGLLLAPRGWPARLLGIAWCIPLLVWTPQRPGQGEVWLTLLDVGQGLSAVVETRNHVLVYDTGPRFGEDFDTGEAVVDPFLRKQGWDRLDLLVVSHGDNDHIGGARSLTAAMPVARVLTGVPERMNWLRAEPCLRGERWRWDDIGFEVLHPASNMSTNDGSCVIRITSAGGALLLTGDIEADAEQAMLASGQSLDARVLVVPHHGSKTSSTDPFVAAVSPEIALFPLGYRNRYRFPHPTVVARYEARRVRRLDSASAGAIIIRLRPDGAMQTETWRDRARRYWHS